MRAKFQVRTHRTSLPHAPTEPYVCYTRACAYACIEAVGCTFLRTFPCAPTRAAQAPTCAYTLTLIHITHLHAHDIECMHTYSSPPHTHTHNTHTHMQSKHSLDLSWPRLTVGCHVVRWQLTPRGQPAPCSRIMSFAPSCSGSSLWR